MEERLTFSSAAAGLDAAAEQIESLEGLVEPGELMGMRAAHLLRVFESSPCAPSWRPSPP